jgi:hypothetical protein
VFSLKLASLSQAIDKQYETQVKSVERKQYQCQQDILFFESKVLHIFDEEIKKYDPDHVARPFDETPQPAV